MFTALRLMALVMMWQAADPTVPPATARQVYVVEGRGVQIYKCVGQGTSFAWVFQAPEAALFDANHQQVGTHGAGPVWTWKDGSSISGKVLQKMASPDAGSVPWLLLAASPVGSTAGVLSPVKFVRRSETKGGGAPSDGCDAGHVDGVVRVPYSATYGFYAER